MNDLYWRYYFIHTKCVQSKSKMVIMDNPSS